MNARAMRSAPTFPVSRLAIYAAPAFAMAMPTIPIYVLLPAFYAEVDRRVQATFSVPFRRSDIVARWYSGDEIVILFDSERIGAVRKMEELAVAAAAEGLTFKFDLGDWDVGKEPVEDVIEQLSRNVMLQKTEEATPVDRS